MVYEIQTINGPVQVESHSKLLVVSVFGKRNPLVTREKVKRVSAAILDPNLTQEEWRGLAAIIESWEK